MRPRGGGGSGRGRGGPPRGRGPGRGGPPRGRGGGGFRPKGPPDDPKTALSKVLSYALRHKPDEFGLNCDEFGFLPLNELVMAIRERPKWAELTEERVIEIINESEKNRFEVRDGLIRARYGHSFDVQPTQDAGEPPEFLYHGTPRNAMGVIMEDGLRSMRRRFVHLSASVGAARAVGIRRDPNPIIIEIAAQKAHADGVKFYPATPEIHLVENVPPPFLREMTDDEARAKHAEQKAAGEGEEKAAAGDEAPSTS